MKENIMSNCVLIHEDKPQSSNNKAEDNPAPNEAISDSTSNTITESINPSENTAVLEALRHSITRQRKMDRKHWRERNMQSTDSNISDNQENDDLKSASVSASSPTTTSSSAAIPSASPSSAPVIKQTSGSISQSCAPNNEVTDDKEVVAGKENAIITDVQMKLMEIANQPVADSPVKTSAPKPAPKQQPANNNQLQVNNEPQAKVSSPIQTHISHQLDPQFERRFLQQAEHIDMLGKEVKSIGSKMGRINKLCDDTDKLFSIVQELSSANKQQTALIQQSVKISQQLPVFQDEIKKNVNTIVKAQNTLTKINKVVNVSKSYFPYMVTALLLVLCFATYLSHRKIEALQYQISILIGQASTHKPDAGKNKGPSGGKNNPSKNKDGK